MDKKKKVSSNSAGSYIVKSIYLPREKSELWEDLKKHASSEGTSLSQLVVKMVENFLYDDFKN